MSIDPRFVEAEEPDDSCDSCSVNTECVACLGDRIYDQERDFRLEDS